MDVKLIDQNFLRSFFLLNCLKLKRKDTGTCVRRDVEPEGLSGPRPILCRLEAALFSLSKDGLLDLLFYYVSCSPSLSFLSVGIFSISFYFKLVSGI